MWITLEIIAVISLIVFWSSRNAVWGGATIGLFVGLIMTFIGHNFLWATVIKSATVGCLIGVLIELFCKIMKKA